MVNLSSVQASNAQIKSSLPSGLVAVFVGATNGIGETTLKQFAKHTIKPRVYFIGRSQEAADRISDECKALNPEGEYSFIKADVSLIKVVDEICAYIKNKEKTINLLFLTQGTLVYQTNTDEGLHLAMALPYYSRNRFIVNLLPLIQQASSLRRVVSVFTGTKEGPIFFEDFEGWKIPPLSGRGHAASLVTLSLEAIQKQAPEVSFVHDFPGPVKSGIARGTKGAFFTIMKAALFVLGPFLYIPNQESGERHLFFATSAKYPAGANDTTAGVALIDGDTVAMGSDGKPATGVYTIDQFGESAGPKVLDLLAKYRKEGMIEKIWTHTEEQFSKITGKAKA